MRLLLLAHQQHDLSPSFIPDASSSQSSSSTTTITSVDSAIIMSSGGGSTSSGNNGVQKQQQHRQTKFTNDSAIVRARFEPDVNGVNRYKHFHRPMLPSPTDSFHDKKQHPDDGQSIDKTSPRRHSKQRRMLASSSLLPLPVINNNSNLASNIRQRAHSSTSSNDVNRPNRRTTTTATGMVDLDCNNGQVLGGLLPQIGIHGDGNYRRRRCQSSNALAATSAVSNENLLTQEKAAERALKQNKGKSNAKTEQMKRPTRKQQSDERKSTIMREDANAWMDNNNNNSRSTTMATSNSRRRRIIISDAAPIEENAAAASTVVAVHHNKHQISPNHQKIAKPSSTIDSYDQSAERQKQKIRKPETKHATKKKMLIVPPKGTESIGTQTDKDETFIVLVDDTAKKNTEFHSEIEEERVVGLERVAIPRATQTETNGGLFHANGVIAGTDWALSNHQTTNTHQDEFEFEQRTQLLTAIERALDETIDRQSRVRTNEFIASTARKQAQIWRDAKMFVTSHLVPRSIELANRSTRHRWKYSSREGSSSALLRSYEMTLRSIQLP